MKAGYRALDAMERHPAERDWLVGDGYTSGDISLYACTRVAHEGRLRPRPLSGHPGVARSSRGPAEPRPIDA
jgi:glutathione S-transferase